METPSPLSSDPGARALLRRAVATVAYRGSKAIRGAPDGFDRFAAGPSTRTPLQILSHVADLFVWALSLVKDEQAWPSDSTRSWAEEAERFHATLAAFDAYLASDAPIRCSIERVYQGPVADALTHVGQLTMLRRIAGAPVRGENYYRAEIETGRVGPDQPAPVREFD